MKIKIGELLLRNKAINSTQLKDALLRQKKTNEKLGKILIDLGYVSHIDLIKYLTLNDIKPAIGEILLYMGFINEKQLKESLMTQKESPDKQIGSILIEKGFIHKELLVQVLTVQAKAKVNGTDSESAENYTLQGKIASEILKKERELTERYTAQKAEEKIRLEKEKLLPPQNGFATLTKDNGDKYMGELKNGLMHGKGIYTNANSRYVGDFFKNNFHGEGTLTSFDGMVIHSGEWKNGKPLK